MTKRKNFNLDDETDKNLNILKQKTKLSRSKIVRLLVNYASKDIEIMKTAIIGDIS